MQIRKYHIFTYVVLMATLLTSVPTTQAISPLADRLKGKILLQVESNGEGWYVNPENSQRYYLGRPADAFRIMRELGLGISNKDFDSFKGKAPKRLSGRILLKVEDSGKAYYVYPDDLQMYYLGRPRDAFGLMRNLGLGISNTDLALVDIASGYDIPSLDKQVLGVQDQTPVSVAHEPPSETTIQYPSDYYENRDRSKLLACLDLVENEYNRKLTQTLNAINVCFDDADSAQLNPLIENPFEKESMAREQRSFCEMQLRVTTKKLDDNRREAKNDCYELYNR